MKILQYNILDGCRTMSRYEKLSKWLEKQDCDVVGFNELNEWTNEEFQEKMKAIGFMHSFLFEAESSPYYVGIAAKYPIEIIRCVEDDPIYHGLIEVKINSIHFFVVHLTPFASTERERETEQIASYVSQTSEPVIVMGDFNTLSPLDKKHYDQMHTRKALERKNVWKTQHIVDNAINYRPMEILLDTGLFDLGHSNSFHCSMPTKINGLQEHPNYLRIDYILVNSIMLKKNPTVKIIRDAEVETLSDHYPVMCYWEEDR